MWFADSPELRDWIYDDEIEGQHFLEAADYVPEVAAAMYLGGQIQAHLTEPVAQELSAQWQTTDVELLLRNINRRDLPSWPSTPQDQIALLRALSGEQPPRSRRDVLRGR